MVNDNLGGGWMPKYRVFELAKEFGATSKVILDILARNDMPVKNHMSSIDENGREIIVRTFARKSDAVAAQEKLAPAIKPEPPKAAQEKTVQPTTQPVKPVKPPEAAAPVRREAPKAPVEQIEKTERPETRPQPPRTAAPVHVPPAPPTGERRVFQPGQKPAAPSHTHTPQSARPVQRPQQGAYSPQQPGQQRHEARGERGDFRPQQPRVGTAAPAGQQQHNRPGGFQQQRPQGAPGQQPYNRPGGFQQQRPQGTPGQQPYNRPGGFQQQRPQGAPGQQPYNNRPGGAPAQQQRSFPPRPDQGFNKKPAAKPGETAGAKPPASQGNKFSYNQKKKGKFQDKKHERPEFIDKSKLSKHAKAGLFVQPTANVQKPTSVEIPEFISIKDFAAALKREVSEVIKCLLGLGVMATINQEIDFDTATLVANEFQVEVKELPPEHDPTEIQEVDDDPQKRLPRAPVVTIMGHVDHGKTSLLDTVRKTNVTAREAGGITQHIGAYQVHYQGKKIVFLDTPGHEAFTSMRARGAKVTDVAILVVAADDGVMPQTIEAINHAKAAEVPIIVAINKMDKPGAAPDRVKQQLTEYGLQAEDWGGQTIMVPVSAHKQTGIAELLEMILLTAEMQELTANPNLPAHGTIIEAELDKGRGPVATVLVQKGTLRVGDTIIAGTAYGKVRAMVNERGESLKKAGPSTPVEVLGLSDVPRAGDILDATDEKTARVVAEKRIAKRRVEEMQQNQKVSLDDIFRQIQDGKLKELNIVVKADVQGTIEALRQALEGIRNEEVKVVVVHSGVGAINESDVMLASAANALIIGFNVRPDANARKTAEAEKVDIETYRVIYDAINDVEAAIKGMLAPKFKEVIQGRVEIRQLITISKILIAGCYVQEGKITRSSKVRLLRNGIVIHEGELESLRRFKDDVKEVAAGYECGLTIDKFRDVKEGDIIEAYIMEEIKPE